MRLSALAHDAVDKLRRTKMSIAVAPLRLRGVGAAFHSQSTKPDFSEWFPHKSYRDATLVPLLGPAKVPMDKIETDYPEFTGIVRALIGIVPVCDSYLEIWPRAFKSYNLIVPNLMNAPFSQLWVGPGYSRGSALQGIGMYAVSRSAECPYCSAHTCSYALRRGASPETLIKGLKQDATTGLAADEKTTIVVGRSLGKIPCELTEDERSAFVDALGESVAESTVFGMIAMGYLNKVMDSIGVELENSTYLETRETVGTDYAASKSGALLSADSVATAPPTVDSLATRLSLLPLVPGALRLDAQYTQGVPNAWPAVGDHLQKTVGYSFPVLSALSRSFLGKRAVRAIATTLIDNYDSEASICTIQVKVMAGAIFAHVAESESLHRDFARLAEVFGVSAEHMTAARSVTAGAIHRAESLPAKLRGLDVQAQSYLRLARAIATSPADVSSELVADLRVAKVDPKGIVELVNFMAITQMLLRIDAFYTKRLT